MDIQHCKNFKNNILENYTFPERGLERIDDGDGTAPLSIACTPSKPRLIPLSLNLDVDNVLLSKGETRESWEFEGRLPKSVIADVGRKGEALIEEVCCCRFSND